MIDNPQYIKVKDKKYKINTSYRAALKCDTIIKDKNINDYEKSIAIILLLFGKEAAKDRNNRNKLLELAYKYLSCNEEPKNKKDKPDMDFQKDFRLIRASFKSDFGIDLLKEDIDWWDFYSYLNGLTENCILNRIRELRTYDVNKIQDAKERQDIIEAKERWKLEEEITMTEEQERNAEEFLKSMGF